MNTPTEKISWMACAALLALLAGCGRAPHPSYQFEPRGSKVLQSIASYSADPQLGLSPSGIVDLLALYGTSDKSRLGMLVSHNGGDSFSSPIPISNADAEVRAQGESSPSLVVTSTAVYALWEQTNAAGPADLMFARSPSGEQFDSPIKVVDKAQPSFNGFASMGVAPNGDVYVAWLDGRNPGQMHGTFSVYLARSTDRGKSFEPNVEVSQGSCPCCRPRIAFGAKGEVLVFWRKVFHGNIRDMVASASADGGKTFAAPVRVAEDNWQIAGCPESGPSAVRLGNRIFVAWMTETHQGKGGVKIAWTDDDGKTFAPAEVVSQGILDANHASMAVSGDRLELLFQGRDSQKDQSWSSLQPYLVEIEASGAMSKPVAVGSEKSITYPVIAADDTGRMFMAWNETSDNGPALVFQRARRNNE